MYDLETPMGKEQTITAVRYWLPNSKILYQTLTPAKIWVNGNYAYVHYYYTQYAEDNEGKKKWEKGRWTDILIKKDGKWIMVGDHGGETK
jgi:ketosteroid isomerase-like protein